MAAAPAAPAVGASPAGTRRPRTRGAGLVRGPGGSVAVAVQPADEYRLPTGIWPDGVSRTRAGIYERFLRVEGRPILVRAWQERGAVTVAAMPAPPAWLDSIPAGESASDDHLIEAIDRGRRALAVDDDLRQLRRQFKADPLLGPLIRRLPGFRVARCPDPWEALLRAIVDQLIESDRAFLILRRIAARWGERLSFEGVPGARPLPEAPSPASIAGAAPAELAAMDLAPKRAIALIAAAKEIAAGRCDPGDIRGDARLKAISSIGPWTLNCLRLFGRGDLDALPAGDLMYLKLVGHLARLGRRATIAEVEELYAPYAPYRGYVGMLTLRGYGKRAAAAGPLRYHPPTPDYEAA